MKYEKPKVVVYDEELINEILAMATSANCKCGNGSSHNGSKRARA